MKKKLFSFITMFAMAFSLLPFCTFRSVVKAAEPEVKCTNYWVINGNEAMVDVKVDGKSLTTSQSSDPIILTSGDTATITLKNAEGWNSKSFFLRYNNQNSVNYTLNENAGVLIGTFIVPNANFAIGIYQERVDSGHKVTFELNGGNMSGENPVTVRSGEKVTKPSDPTKTNHRFDGWYDSNTYTTEFDFENTYIESPTTIYAKFVEQVTVNFDFNGGTNIGIADPYGTADKGTTINYDTLAELVKGQVTPPSGEEFNTFEIDGTEWDSGDYTVNSNTTVKILWKSATITPTQYEVKFINAVDNSTISTTKINDGETVTKPTTDPTKTGYTFEDWFEDNTCTTKFDFSSFITTDKEIYACFTLNTTTSSSGGGGSSSVYSSESSKTGYTNTGTTETSTGTTETSTGSTEIEEEKTETGTVTEESDSTKTETTTSTSAIKECVITGELSFTDIGDTFAKCYIQDLANKGFIKGYGDGTFRPENNITRGEFLAIVMRSLEINLDSSTVHSFTDIPANSDWNKYVNKALELGIISKDNTNFRPDAPITREEAMKILMTTWGVEISEITISSYNDVDGWSMKYIEKALDLKIVSPAGTFRPQDNITRAEVAKIVYNVVNLEK